MIGQRVGPYAVLQRLGGGGMGEVYLAEDTRLGRQVALKRPSESWLSLPDARERLHREASAAGRLTHPNIAAIYDVLDVDSHPYIVMEYVEGESLVRVLGRGALPLDRAITVATEITEALAAAHAKGIVHRDLKPANISLTPDGHAKVLDFGLAKGPTAKATTTGTGLSTITVPGQAMGTPGYSSPEQLVGAPADPRDDLYSMGVVLYELVTGRRPFDGTDSLELAMATMTKTPPPAHQVNPAVPEALSAIVSRAMARDRDDRYQSAEELRTELRRLTHALSTEVTHLISTGSLRLPRGRVRRAAPIVLLALVVAAVAGVWWKFGRPAAPDTRPPVLGVLPFANNGLEADAPLAAGIRDVLIATLGSTRGLNVLSKLATDEEGVPRGDPRKLARNLGATHLLDGGLQRSGRDLMISVTLSRGDSGLVVWSGSFSAAEKDIFPLQQRVADGVRRALSIATSPAAEGSGRNAGTHDVDALAFYGRAMGFLERADIAGSLQRAATLLRSAVERDPGFALAWARLGEAYWETYQRTSETKWASDAVDATNKALTLDQRQPEVWISLARIHDGTGRREEALNDLKKALSLQPDSDEAHQLMGLVLQAMGRREEATDHYLKAIAIRPDYWRHHNRLGGFYYSIGRYADAIAAFTRVTELLPDNARGFHNLGAVYYRTGDNTNALIFYQKAIAIEPMAETHSAIGNIHFDAGRYDAALAAFQQAVAAAPNDGALRGNVGDAYARLNRQDAARQAWREAVRLDGQALAVNPNDASILARLALREAKLGERTASEGHVTRALTLGANDSEVLYHAAVVRALNGETERALTSLEQALQNGYSATLAAKDRDLDAIKDTPRFRALVSSRK